MLRAYPRTLREGASGRESWRFQMFWQTVLRRAVNLIVNTMSTWRRVWLALFLAVGVPSSEVLLLAEELPVPASPVQASPVRAPVQPVAAPVSPVPFEFNGPVTLESLIEFVSQQLDLGILYSNEIQGESITIRQATGTIDKATLRPFLESVLRTKGFSLVDDLTPGFTRVVPFSQAAAQMSATPAIVLNQRNSSSQVITRVFTLRYQNAEAIAKVISNFLTPSVGSRPVKRSRGAATKSKGSGGVSVVNLQNALLVTDFADNIERIATLIEQLDVRSAPATIEAIALQHASGKELVPQLKRLLENTAKSGESKKNAMAQTTEVLFDSHSNQLLIVGLPIDVRQIKQAIRELDVPVNEITRDYEIRHGSVGPIEESLHKLLDASKEAVAFKSAASLNNNRLIVQARPNVHRQIEALLKEIDVRQPDGQGRLHTHHLQHVTAAQILVTLQGLGVSTTSTNSLAEPSLNTGLQGQSALPNTPAAGGSRAQSRTRTPTSTSGQ